VFKFLISIIAFLFVANYSLGQTPKNKKMDIDDAEEHFKHNNFLMAIPIYKQELKKDPDNKKIKYKLGICYLNTKVNREEAIKYFEEYVKEPKHDEKAWLFLGRAYHVANRVDDAIAAFEKYKSMKTFKDSEVRRDLQMCENAQKLMSEPVNVIFQNLGKEINSPEPDYYPFVNSNETFLAFTSRRKDNIGGKKIEIDGYRSSDVYFSNVVDGKWSLALNAGRKINGGLDEQVVGMRSDGNEIYVYLDHIDKFGDLYITNRKTLEEEFAKPKKCDQIINQKLESSGCLNEEGNVLFFARREKAEANSDLFVCRKLPTGKWGLPQKLPEIVNTSFNEDFPYLSTDGVTLYFASEGIIRWAALIFLKRHGTQNSTFFQNRKI
jgi:hypothetical protein